MGITDFSTGTEPIFATPDCCRHLADTMPIMEDCSTAVQRVLQSVIKSALFAFVLLSVISLSGMQAAYILAVAAWLVGLCLQRRDAQIQAPLGLPVCAFALASALATLTAVAPLLSLIELRNVCEIILFFLVVNQVKTSAHATALTRVLIVAGTVMALYGLSQSFALGANFRIHGMFGYMTFANVLVLIDLMALTQLLFNHNGRWALWLALAILLLTAAILMTQTRGSWLGLAVGVTVVMGLRGSKRLLLFLPLVMCITFLLVPHTVRDRIRSIVDLQNVTAQIRLCKWRVGLNIIRAYPWTGVGMDGIGKVYLSYKAPGDPVACGDRRLGHLDNNMMQIAVERGLIGLLCWLSIWVAYVRRTWSVYRGIDPQQGGARALVVGSLASVVGFHVAGLFEYTFGDAEVVTLVYFLMAFPFLFEHRNNCTT